MSPLWIIFSIFLVLAAANSGALAQEDNERRIIFTPCPTASDGPMESEAGICAALDMTNKDVCLDDTSSAVLTIGNMPFELSQTLPDQNISIVNQDRPLVTGRLVTTNLDEREEERRRWSVEIKRYNHEIWENTLSMNLTVKGINCVDDGFLVFLRAVVGLSTYKTPPFKLFTVPNGCDTQLQKTMVNQTCPRIPPNKCETTDDKQIEMLEGINDNILAVDKQSTKFHADHMKKLDNILESINAATPKQSQVWTNISTIWLPFFLMMFVYYKGEETRKFVTAWLDWLPQYQGIHGQAPRTSV